MEELWKRARTFAEEATKKSRSLSSSSASTRFADPVSETAKKLKELAAEASKKAEEIKPPALKQADQIKSFSDNISIPSQFFIPPQFSTAPSSASSQKEDFEKFGVTDDLRSFVKGLASTTFQNFPISSDESEASDVLTSSSNVRKDLNEFQEKHATLVLTTVKKDANLNNYRAKVFPYFDRLMSFSRRTVQHTHGNNASNLLRETIRLGDDDIQDITQSMFMNQGSSKAQDSHFGSQLVRKRPRGENELATSMEKFANNLVEVVGNSAERMGVIAESVQCVAEGMKVVRDFYDDTRYC